MPYILVSWRAWINQVMRVWCLQPGGCLQLIYTKTMSLLIFPSAATCYGQHLFLKNRWELQAEPANDSPASWVWRLRVWRLASKALTELSRIMSLASASLASGIYSVNTFSNPSSPTFRHSSTDRRHLISDMRHSVGNSVQTRILTVDTPLY